MRERHSRRHILISFLGTYIPIVLMGVSAVLGVFYTLSKSLQREINQQYYHNTVQLQLQLDQALKTIRQQAYAFRWDNRLAALSRDPAPLRAESIYSLYEIIQDLKSRSTLASAYPSTTLLYFKGTDSVVSVSGCGSSYSYFERYIAKYQMTYEEWMALLTTGTGNEYLSKTVSRQEQPQTCLFWAEPVSYGESLFSVMAMVDLNQLIRAQAQPLLTKGGCFQLLDRDGTVLYTDGAPDTAILTGTAKNLSVQPDIHEIKTGRGKMAVVSQGMQAQSWTCVTMVPLSVLYEELETAYPMLLAVTGVLLVCGAGFTAYSLIRNYYPVKRLQRLASSQLAGEAQEPDGYLLIESALVNMMDTNQKISDTILHQESMIRQNFLLELLVGRGRRPQQELFKLCPLLAQGPVWLLSFFNIEAEQANGEIDSALQAQIQAETISCAYPVAVESSVFCLVGLKGQKVPGRLTAALDGLLKALRKKSPRCFCAVSEPKPSWKSFPQAYNEVLVSSELFGELTPDRIIPYSQTKKKISQEYKRALSPALQKRFAYLLSAREFGQARQLISDLFLQLQGEEGLSLYIAKSRSFMLFNEAVNALGAENQEAGKLLSEESDWLERILCANSFSALKSAMLESVHLMESIQRSEPAKAPAPAVPHTTQVVQEVQAYIESHFQDANLNVSTIADEFHLSLSYLSKIFKEVAGRNVLDYINCTRVEYAKKLLRETHQSVKTIAENAGFYNANTLIRCLKKYEGMTPGQYREQFSSGPSALQ